MLMMAIVVSLLSSSGDTPDVRVALAGYMTASACLEWQTVMGSSTPSSIDPIEGRQLEAVTYQCIPVQGDMHLEDLRKALASAE